MSPSHHHHHAHDESDHTPHHANKTAIWRRMAFALLLVLFALAAACLVQVRSGEAEVVTRFGDPVRVLLEPGLAWHLPAPIELSTPVDLRLRTTSSGLQDVGTKDGLRIIVQAYVVWQVKSDKDDVKRFMRAVQNKPSEAARQLRTFVGSALEATASSYNLSSLVNTDGSKVQIDDFENKLRGQIEKSLLDTYGVRVVQVGIERLTLPVVTLSATVDRMRAERETIATQRTAEGKRQAAQIVSSAQKEARIITADAKVKAADLEAKSIVQSADIYGQAQKEAPKLYDLLRSLDTLSRIINGNTHLVLRTDSAPFKALIDGPDSVDGSSRSDSSGHSNNKGKVEAAKP